MSTPLSDRTVLVTGGAGFVGSHLAAALVPDNEVRVLDDCSTGDPERVPDDAELYAADVRDEAALERAMADVDCVFHQAAMVSVPESVERPLDCHRTNTDATAALLDRARRTDTRVVLASSAAVYGDPASTPVAEDDPTAPTAPYGVSKLATDHLARVYADRYDLPTVSLRYFNVYGTGANGGVVDTFCRRALAGESLVVHGDGEQTRDFVHVDDVVAANLLAATTEHTGTVYNVGTGRGVAIRALAERVSDLAPTDVAVSHAAERVGDIRHSCANVSRARARLGFEPSVGLEAGLRRTIAGYRSNRASP
jgi:UDP-glucose 4-epimerase